MFSLSISKFILYCFFAVPLFWFDITRFILPNKLVLGLFISGLLINFININNLYNAILGCILGYFLLYIIYWIYYLIKKNEGLGRGDIKLFSALCTWFGVNYLPDLLFYSSTLGIISIIFLNNVIKRNKKIYCIPFGACLLFVGFIFLIIYS